MKTKEFFGHPKGLAVLFFTEMWERFSYYGMRALLVLYMTKSLLVSIENGTQVFGYPALKTFIEFMFGPQTTQAMSSQIYGIYTGFVYLTPFFGGMIADRILGQRRSVYLGGVLMAIGHFLMAFESFFLPALLFLIFGNGFFKPNISTQVGSLYPEGDKRRDRAFTIFYMGVNLGAFFSPLVCGTLGQVYGWHYGFAAAGVGMIVGLIVYHLGQKHLPAERPIKAVKKENKQKLTKQEWQRIIALVWLCMITILFWGVYEQQGNTLQLWADNNTDWNFFGIEIPSTWFQSMNPFIIFVMAPFLDMLWGWQSRKGKEPSTVGKMLIGCFLMAIAYLIMVANVHFVGTEVKGSVMWLFSTTFLFTIGELFLSPIGLSLVTKVAPPSMVSMLMGVWFLSSFFGNYLSGYIGAFYESMGQGPFFWLMSAMSALAGVLFLVTMKPLKKVITN